jgi:hypothetical protein
MYERIQYVMYMSVCVRERERQFRSLSQPYQRLAPLIPLECTGECSATARRAAVTCVRDGANLNCTSQLRTIFSHPCTAYLQLQFWKQSLLDRLCKHVKFQARFRPDKPDHSPVSYLVLWRNSLATKHHWCNTMEWNYFLTIPMVR